MLNLEILTPKQKEIVKKMMVVPWNREKLAKYFNVTTKTMTTHLENIFIRLYDTYQSRRTNIRIKMMFEYHELFMIDNEDIKEILTPTEYNIAYYLANTTLTQEEIANKLHFSKATIIGNCTIIYDKLYINNRYELVLLWHKIPFDK